MLWHRECEDGNDKGIYVDSRLCGNDIRESESDNRKKGNDKGESEATTENAVRQSDRVYI